MSDLGNKYVAREIKIADIKIGKDRRSLKPEKVDELAESIASLGLKTPIVVREAKFFGRPVIELVSGLHRLEGMKRLGAETISCIVMEGDERQARLWEISENLHRAELTPLEYDEHVAEWVRLIEEEDEDEESDRISGQNVQKLGPGRPKGGIKQAAIKLPVKGRTDDAKRKNVERAIKVAGIDAAAKEEAKKAGLDQEHTALLKIAAEKTTKAQLTKVRELAARKADKKKRSSSGRGPRKAKKAEPLSQADKKSLQALVETWEKCVKAAFAKASSVVRSEFIKEIQRAPSAVAERSGWGKK